MKDHISAVRPRTLPKPAGFSYGYEDKSGRLVFVAGQVAVDADGRIVGRGDLVAQFRKHFPAMTLVGARDLFDAAEGALIEIEGVAALA